MNLDGGNRQQRSMLVPVLIALLLLAAAGLWFAKVYLHPAIAGKVDRVGLFPVHVQYKRGSGILVGADQTEDALYVVADVTLTDRSEVPLFLKDINGSFTMADGTVMKANAIEQADLPRLAAMYPKLKPITDATGAAPLLRESSIAPGATGSGWVVFAYNVPQAVWDKRSAADVTVDFYHHDSMTLPLPK